MLGLASASKPGQVIGPAGWPFGILLLVWALGTIVPNIAVSVRRLHDAGYSGWFYLFNIVGLGIVTLVLCALETSPKAPQYGPPYPDNFGQQQGYGQQPYGQPGFEQQRGYGQQPAPSSRAMGSSLAPSSTAMGSSRAIQPATSNRRSRPAEPAVASRWAVQPSLH